MYTIYLYHRITKKQDPRHHQHLTPLTPLILQIPTNPNLIPKTLQPDPLHSRVPIPIYLAY